jgi:hypothetical protein
MSCFPDRGEAVDDYWWCLLVVELCLDCLLNPISARIPNGCLSELALLGSCVSTPAAVFRISTSHLSDYGVVMS